MVVNAMNVIAVMGNTSNAEASIRQQKLSLLSIRGKKGGDSRNHRPLFNEDKNMLKPGLMMAQVGQKSRTFLGSKNVSSLEQHKPLLNRIWSRLNNAKKVVTTCLLGSPRPLGRS